jgi:nitrite reductase/ring-hydroxylating ferredoxin subunit
MLTPEQNATITRTGPGTAMGDLWRRFWVPALLAEELPAPDCPPVRVRLMGEDLVAFKDSEGQVGLLDAHCPHRLADLFFGRNEECGLRCVYHGWKFDVTGECVDMPNEPAESNFKSKIKTTAYPCREWGGLVWAYLGPKEKMPELPHLGWALVPDAHRYVAKMEVECNYLQAMEGDIDNSHASFLHTTLTPETIMSLFPGGGKDIPSDFAAKDRAPRLSVKDTDYGFMIGARRNHDAGHFMWHITQWLMPGFAIVGEPRPGSTILCNARVPRDDETSWFFRISWNSTRPLTDDERFRFRHGNHVYPEMISGTFRPKANKDNDYLIDRSLQRSFSYTGIRSITQQDRAVTESMGTVVDRSREHLGTSDTAILAMRRRMLKAARELQHGIDPYPAYHGEVYKVSSCGILLPRDVPFDEGARELMYSLA